MNDPIIPFSVGTTLPAVTVSLQSTLGDPLDLSDAATVTMRLTDVRTNTLVAVGADIIVATQGIVTATMPATVTDEPGEWLARWRVTYPSGDGLDVPNAGHVRISIT